MLFVQTIKGESPQQKDGDDNSEEQRQTRFTQAKKGYDLVSTVRIDENSSPDAVQQSHPTQRSRRVRRPIEFDKPNFACIDKQSA